VAFCALTVTLWSSVSLVRPPASTPTEVLLAIAVTFVVARLHAVAAS